MGMTEAFFTTAKEETLSESKIDRNEREKVKEKKNKQRKHRNKLVKIQQWRLSFLVWKHVRYVLEEDTKDDSWSSSFGPASKLFNQPVSAAANSAL